MSADDAPQTTPPTRTEGTRSTGAEEERAGPTPGALRRSLPAAVSGPSGLTDQEVSPLGIPLALLHGEIRVAFLGRTSTDDQQDPRQSMIRQLGKAREPLPTSWVIVCHFYDVESGRMSLDDRGRGSDYERFNIPIPRDGGITDLLEEAKDPGRRFDVVICESVSRVARRMFEGVSVERALEQADVCLFASNEPITVSGSRAQRILQRRINQAVAEFEVLNTLELSWGGLCTHVRDGWNIGKPPYGYRAKTVRHPNPTKAARGATKTQLEPDGERALTVGQIALWRRQGLGYGTIAERLNADLKAYPPPTPVGGAYRARGAWGKTSVFEILNNPKYTGYQVFNRRASRSRQGKVNDPRKWVWSPVLTHEPLIAKTLFDQLRAARQTNRGSRSGADANAHPAARHNYLLRGLLFCACGRRMWGNTRRGLTYYQCWPRGSNRGREDRYADHHPRSYLNEPALLDTLSRFYTERVFGPDRHALLAAALPDADDQARQTRDTERQRLQRAIADLARRQHIILRQVQDSDDPTDPFTRDLRRTYNDLDAHKTAALENVAALDLVDSEEQPHRIDPAAPALLDALPYLTLKFSHAPQPLLRDLFDATRLSIEMHPDSDDVTINITLAAHELPAVSHTAARVPDSHTPERKTPRSDGPTAVTDAVRAPGGIRTHTGTILSGLPLPVGLRGRRARVRPRWKADRKWPQRPKDSSHDASRTHHHQLLRRRPREGRRVVHRPAGRSALLRGARRLPGVPDRRRRG